MLGAAEAVTGAEVGRHHPRITWQDAMERYGSDKPDIRFGMELVELTDVFAETGFKAFAGVRQGHPGAGRRRLLPQAARRPHRRAKRWGAKGLVWMRVGDDAARQPGGQVPVRRRAGRHPRTAGAEPGDLLLLVADQRPVVRHVLGLLRLELGARR